MTESSCGVLGTSDPDRKLEYRKILVENGIASENSQIDLASPPFGGTNFASICEYMTIRKKEEDKNPVELFVKRIVTNPGQLEMLTDMKLFKKESEFFNILVPRMTNFVNSRLDSTTSGKYELDMIPKCFYANEKIVMLENLTKKGYVLLNKVDRQDLDHAKVCMRNLAKFHAPSYLMIKEDPGSVQGFLQKYPCAEDGLFYDGADKHFAEWLDSCFDLVSKIFKKFYEPSDEFDYALKMVHDLKSIGLILLAKQFYQYDNGHICFVLNHGDSWNNNMLFRYDGRTKKILHHVLLDFQILRAGTPNIDIAYYLFTTMKQPLRRKEGWKDLLRIYYDTFQEYVTMLNGTVDFTFDEFLGDFKQNFVAGFLFGVAMTATFDAYGDLGNLNEVEGPLQEHMHQVVENWLTNNSEKAKLCAEELVQVFQEYKELMEEPE